MLRVSFELEFEASNLYEAEARALNTAARFFSVEPEEISERIASEIKVKLANDPEKFLVTAHIQLKNPVITTKFN